MVLAQGMFGFKTPVFLTQAAHKRCVARKRWKPMPKWLGLDADVEVGVDVRCAAEVPDH